LTGFLLIRHGSCAHVGRSLAGRQRGVHLDEEGRRQALELAERLVDARLDALYSSPLERATETAAPIAERLGLEVQISDALVEVDVGEWTGKAFTELDGRGDWKAWNLLRSISRPPGGEGALHIAARVIGELQLLRERHDGGWVGLVTHADVIRTALAHIAGIPLDMMLRIEIDPASVSVIALEPWGPRILRVNEGRSGPWMRSR
jgi:broad specificity phosphatase PhoE